MIDAGRYLQNIREHVISRLIEDGRADYAARIAACDYHGFRCNLHHICPLCRYSRGLSFRNQLLIGIRASLEMGQRFTTIGLTVPDTPLSSLRQRFTHMRKCVRKITSQIAGLTGAAWAFESLPAHQDIELEHPHWHGLLAIDPLKNRGARYTSGLRLHQLWADCEPGGAADTSPPVINFASDISPPVINLDDPIFARAHLNMLAKRAKYSSYMVKGSPEQVIRQTSDELEHGFTERVSQLSGLHRISISGSLDHQPAHRAA